MIRCQRTLRSNSAPESINHNTDCYSKHVPEVLAGFLFVDARFMVLHVNLPKL